MGAPKLTTENINTAVQLLDSWMGKLTWDRYLAVLQTQIGHKYTKAAMLRHTRIKSAWAHAKARATDSAPEGGYGNAALSQAQKKIQELENRVERLTRENHQLLEQFLRWSHNAIRRGLSPEDLDRPLPSSKR